MTLKQHIRFAADTFAAIREDLSDHCDSLQNNPNMLQRSVTALHEFEAHVVKWIDGLGDDVSALDHTHNVWRCTRSM